MVQKSVLFVIIFHLCVTCAVWITGKFAGQTPSTTFTHTLEWKQEQLTQLCVSSCTSGASALLTGMGELDCEPHLNTCDVIM